MSKNLISGDAGSRTQVQKYSKLIFYTAFN